MNEEERREVEIVERTSSSYTPGQVVVIVQCEVPQYGTIVVTAWLFVKCQVGNFFVFPIVYTVVRSYSSVFLNDRSMLHEKKKKK